MLKNIWELFTENGLFIKKNGLLINRKNILFVPENTQKEMLRLYADMTSRLGVELAGFEPPLTSDSPEDALTIALDPSVKPGRCRLELADGGARLIASSTEDLQIGVQYLVCGYPLMKGSDSSQQHIELERSTAFRCESAGYAASYDRAKEHFEQNLDVRMVINEKTEAEPEAILAMALRMALENYETVYPYAVTEAQQGRRCITFQKAEACFMEKTPEGINICGTEPELTEMIYAFAKEEVYPFQMQLKQDLKEILACRNEVGQVAEGIRLACGKVDTCADIERILVTKEYSRAMVDRTALQSFLSEKIGPASLKTFHDEKEVLHKIWRHTWEGDDFMKAFEEKVLSRVKAGDRVRISGRLSEDLDVRRQLEEKIEAAVSEKGAFCEAEIFRAFKSGYSWIEEKVLPKLQKEGLDEAVAKVIIQFPYLLNERGDDTFEDESTPNYGVHRDDPLKYFDIPTRWLQELFPVDELLARELKLDTDAVEFVRADELPATYRLICKDQEDRELFREDFDVKYVQKAYIKKYPQIGKTHVTTGWLSAEINGEQVADLRVETDPEKVWRTLEEEIIPMLESYLLQRYGVDGLVKAQPLFNRLQLNVTMSEMDFDLGFRQERISTAEAMQEDLYFYLLDWFKTYGERECGKELDNVGLIMPEPEIAKGEETVIEMILSDDFADGPFLQLGGKVFPLQENNIKLCVNRLSFADGMITAEMTCGSEAVIERAMVLDRMIKAGVIDFYAERPVKVYIQGGCRRAELLIPERKPETMVLSEREKERLLAEEVIDYQQYLQLLHYYEDKEDLRLFPVETTYKGRKIFAVECIRRDRNVCYAENKLKTERISAAFTARHHGNEASSLNSTFMLLDRLLGDLGHELDRINVILVPFINIDGGMLHCSVQRKHPKWLCHPARYNSAGFEFRKDFNNPKSKYGEARLLGKLWNYYLFDIITDNHGFEGHELCQPFSGYISPWYKSFWVPRAFYYGYIWFQGDRKHMVEIGSRIRQAVADAMNGDPEIHGLNKEFADRFYKYAEKWFPDLFRLDRFQDVVFYWIDTNEKPRAANYGIRNPEITAIDWTTEMADETAVGDYMSSNARGHHISDLALFQVMDQCPLIWDSAVKCEAEPPVYIKFRRHPLFAEAE